MIELFINTDEEMKIGQIDSGWVLNQDAQRIHISIKVIRKAELKEYLNFVESHGLSHAVRRNIGDKHLYLVEVLD